MVNSIFKQYPLLFKLVCYVLGFSLFVAISLSAIQLWLAYTGELAKIQEQLAELRVSHESSLVNNLWNMDNEGLDIQLNSILDIPDVVAVELEDSEGKIVRRGELPDDLSRCVIENFSLKKQLKEKNLSLGQVTIYAFPTELKKRLWQEVPVSLMADAIALLLTGAFVLILFLVKYNRHINRIAEFAQNLDVEDIGKQLTLDRRKNGDSQPDELDRIVRSINEMQSRVNDQIQAQLQTAKRLQREIAFSDAIIDSLPGIFVVFNEELKTVLFNESFAEKPGLKNSESNGFLFLQSVVPEDQKRFEKILQGVFTDKKSVTIELQLLSANEKRIPYLFNGSYFLLEEQGYIIALGTNLTEQKKMENMLNQAQQMEAIGTLAGGIAHDFNNILSSIMGNLQLAQIVKNDPEKLDNYLQSGVDASIRAKHLIAQILTMGRNEQLDKQSLQVSLIVEETMSLLRATIPTTIYFKQVIESNGYIWANATQMQQILLNLCTNAYHAMQDSGGVLTVSLKEEQITKSQRLPAFDLPEGKYIKLEITDTGCGMDNKTCKMIFEPYYTTKEKGSGTGLGLAVVHGIVQSHEGHITVYSEPGKGTIFRLYFPLLSDSVQDADIDIIEDVFPRGTERLLLVDDEEEILSVYSELLRAHGYLIKSFSNSLDALNHFRKNPSAYDLVLTDMTMPNLSGDILGQKIMQIMPDIPVIICTGFSKVMESGDSLAAGFAAYLTKPVEAGELLFTIRKVLDAKGFKSLKVLLVDDDPYNQKVVTMLLQAQGHQVCVAENGKICLQKISSQDFDVVFMDMQMPELDGLQATTIIRACETGGEKQLEFDKFTGKSSKILYGKHIPVIAMTGNLDEESRQQCKEAGMDDFLAKPFTIQTVSGILARVAKQSIVLTEEGTPAFSEIIEEEKTNLAESSLNHLRQKYPLNDEQLQQLLSESVLSIRQSIQEIEETLVQGDFPTLAGKAHKIKGVVMGLGAENCVELCRELEKSAKKSDHERSTTIVGKLKQLLRSLLEYK